MALGSLNQGSLLKNIGGSGNGVVMPYSIITSTQKIAVKGLSCISNDTPKVLAKTDIPLTYAAVKAKYDSTETEQSDVTEIPLTDGVQHRCIYKENGEYFFSCNIGYNQIRKSS